MRLTEFEQDAICDVLNGKQHSSDMPMERLYRVVERIVESHQANPPRATRRPDIYMRAVDTRRNVIVNNRAITTPKETT